MVQPGSLRGIQSREGEGAGQRAEEGFQRGWGLSQLEAFVDLNKGAELPPWDSWGSPPPPVSLAQERELSALKGSMGSGCRRAQGGPFL